MILSFNGVHLVVFVDHSKISCLLSVAHVYHCLYRHSYMFGTFWTS